MDLVSSSFPHLVPDLARDFSTGSSRLLSALRSSAPPVSLPSVPPSSSSPSVPPFVAHFPTSSFSAPPRFPTPFPSSPLPPSAPLAPPAPAPSAYVPPHPFAPLSSPPPPSSLLPPLYQGGASAVVQGGVFSVPFSSASTFFPGVPHASSLAPSSRSVDVGVPISSAAHVVPVAPPPPVFDPLAQSSVPQFDDSAFDHGVGQFDEDAPFSDPSAPPLSLDSSRSEYRRMVEYVLGLFPQASGAPPSAPPPRALFESFFAASTPTSTDLHFNWFDRVRQSLNDADSRMAAFLSSGCSDRVFLPSRRLPHAVRGDHAGAKAVPVNKSLLAHLSVLYDLAFLLVFLSRIRCPWSLLFAANLSLSLMPYGSCLVCWGLCVSRGSPPLTRLFLTNWSLLCRRVWRIRRLLRRHRSRIFAPSAGNSICRIFQLIFPTRRNALCWSLLRFMRMLCLLSLTLLVFWMRLARLPV